MYESARDIDFVSFYGFSTGFLELFQKCGILWVFSPFYYKIQKKNQSEREVMDINDSDLRHYPTLNFDTY